MGLEIFSLIGGFPFLPGPLERSSTVVGILRIHIQNVSTKFLIPAGSMFVVLKTSQKFSEFQKIRELDIIEKFAKL